MPVLPRLTSFFRTLTRGPRLDAELDDELRAYVDLLTEEKMAAGLTPEAARRAALVDVGGVEQVKERVRDVRVGVWLDTVWQDVRHAVRGFRRSPWFTATAVASLAIGIGFNAAIFSALDAVLFQPLPYKDPERIVEITIGDFSNEVSGVFPGQVDKWEHAATLFERMGVADWYHTTAALRDGPTLTLISVLRASSGFLSVFGVQPVRGRLLWPQDDVPGSNVAVITYDAWLRYWRGDTSVLGRSVKIDGTAYTIVGIMPAGFSLYHPVNQYHPPTTDDRTVYDIFLSDPWALMPRTNGTGWLLWGIGRLKPGVTRAQATAELSSLQSAISRGAKATALPFAWIGRETSTSLWIAWGAVAALLLLAATNIANLLLARASARRQEIGIRAAIGASRRRLVRQLLTESLLLALWGGIAGALLNVWLMPLLPRIIPGAEQLPRLAQARTSWSVLGFTLLVSVVIGVGFGIAPALGGSNRGSMAILIGRRTAGRPAAVRGRRVLLVSQVALSLVLLAGAGLMLATAARLLAEPLGFDPSGLLTFSVEAPRSPAYVTDLGLREVNEQMRARFWAATPRLHALPKLLTDSLRRVPGVISVAVADGVPMYQGSGVRLGLPDQPPPTKEQRKDGVWWAHVTQGFFDTLGIHLVYGRTFPRPTTRDRRLSRLSVGRSLARTGRPRRRPSGGASAWTTWSPSHEKSSASWRTSGSGSGTGCPRSTLRTPKDYQRSGMTWMSGRATTTWPCALIRT
jgi:putative ABC transport system permease protein